MAKDTTIVAIKRGRVNKGKFRDKVVKLPRFLRVCPVCSINFFTDRASQVYCSRRCRNTAAMRRYRARKSQEEVKSNEVVGVS